MNFKDGSIDDVVVRLLNPYTDDRGYLIELWRDDELNDEGYPPEMGYYSLTLPEVQRGPHQHETQTDRFIFLGPGQMEVSLWDVRSESATFGNKMVFIANIRPNHNLGLPCVIVPPRVIHAYRNTSDMEHSIVLNFPDLLYAGWKRKSPVDEVRWEGIPEEEFKDVE